jgi:hypothetical protein
LKIVKIKPIEFLKNMVSKNVPIEVSAKYRDVEEVEIGIRPVPCGKCKSLRLSIVLDTDELGRVCFEYDGKIWKEDMPAPFVVMCKCGNHGPVGYNNEGAIQKWNATQTPT